MTGYDVVIPAGGTIDAAYAQAIGTPYRVLAPMGLDRRPLLQEIIGTLRATGLTRRVIVVAPLVVQKAVSGVDLWLPAGASGATNILHGLAEASPETRALICTSDLPLLTTESVMDFLARSRPEAEIVAGLVRAEDYNRLFSEAPPSQFVRLADIGPVTVGGLFLVHPRLLTRHAALFDRMFRSRKDQWRMAGLLGPRLLWEWATGRLTLRALTERAEAQLGGPVQIVPDVSPLLAYDIDTADDYTYALLRLGQRAAAPSEPLSP